MRRKDRDFNSALIVILIASQHLLESRAKQAFAIRALKLHRYVSQRRGHHHTV